MYGVAGERYPPPKRKKTPGKASFHASIAGQGLMGFLATSVLHALQDWVYGSHLRLEATSAILSRRVEKIQLRCELMFAVQ